MNDLITLESKFPSIVEGLKRAESIFDSIKSMADIERVFLKGAGLSQNTYNAYLQAVKQFYEYTNHKHPLQCTQGDIEAFYDDLCSKVDRKTAYLRIMGLKRFFKGIRNVIPIYTSPFEVMDERLYKKLHKTKTGKKTKSALFKGEIQRMIDFLNKGKSIKDLENRAIIFMLLTSGLRASELCSIRWKDIYENEDDNTIYATVERKGGNIEDVELYKIAIEAVKIYFKKHLKRNPKPDDYLFYTTPIAAINKVERMTYQTLYLRVKAIGQSLRDADIIKRDIQFTPHLMRRSFATFLSKEGMGLKAIQLKTGHSNIETLAKHYIDESESTANYFQELLPEIA